ncbi:hypothetical protein BDP81DRAFT_420763 [Colletotrichum phormii]|uniref:Uncharacterized protein n=1 Tax=Colletotrichum phormii TaxID=359342 RepID=A0AAI9ZYK9_9PEZI|nr:uncharacterized protein BDP81DRAFT_420763 [Colletotrichum phormii]KAK1639318.1 hypothetical protein BDP81DRAFT_420763 [Colletotrichum phormii]
MQVPLPGFERLAFSNLATYWPRLESIGLFNLEYDGAKQEVQRVVTQTAAAGEVLPITPPTINASWQVSFEGPHLSRAPRTCLSSNRLDVFVHRMVW